MMQSKYRVLKFGGSSVASATHISRVLDIVAAEAAKGRVILVSSAISGCTDALLRIAEEGGASAEHPDLGVLRERHRAIAARLFTGVEKEALLAHLDGLFAAMLDAPDEEKVTYGEIFSTTLLAAKLEAEGYRTVWLDSRRLVVKDDLPETGRRIREALAEEADIYVAPGFICCDGAGRITTLGRGGSDYSAALYAAAVQAVSLQIWTDVPGIMTADPRRVPQARTIPEMSYDEAFRMARRGAKVLYAPTVAPALEAGIAIEILNTFAPEGGKTVISAAARRGGTVGIASLPCDGLVKICLVSRADGLAGDDGRIRTAVRALEEAGIAPLDVVPDGPDVLLTVRPAVEVAALRALHRAFFETLPVSEVPLFVAGYGAVGKALQEMVARTAETVAARTGKSLRLVGIADSRHYSIDPSGHPGPPSQEGDYVAAVCRCAPKGSVFVDCTDSETLYRRYPELFAAGLDVVSSNRRSFAVPYVEYASLLAAARENGVSLRYETTVGAALPILESISRGADSCDEVLSIEAVVSCTLNQILSEYEPGRNTFADLVRKAQAAGLTEPDPRQDLGGRDALRKLLILAREAGVRLEEEEVEIRPLIPRSLFEVPLEAFYRGLDEMEPVFAEASRQALRQGFRRRFVASLDKTEDGYRALIRVRQVPPEHPAYYLRGTENAIIIRSAFHPYPLVIQGPGEGAREAASSILGDILR